MQHLLSIQALRALAAIMVVFHHAQNDAGRTAAEIGQPFERFFALPWASGVDLFFVVSGFVMVFSSEKMFAAPGGAGQFISRRIARIVPLYWLATAVFLVAVLRGAAAGKALAPSLGEIVSSFAFLPWPRGLDGAPRPVLSLGWTLEYEMFFYLVFACFLWLPRTRAVAGVAAFLGALVLANVAFRPQNIALAYWSDPIVLEFALGMGIALTHRAGVRLSGLAALGLAVPALAVLACDPMHSASEGFDALDPNGFLRLFSWGAPMAALFAAIVLRERRPQAGAAMRMAATVGDASYALYLFHPLALIVLRKLWLAGHLERFGFWPLVIASTLASVALALAIYRWIETPLTRFAQARLVRRPAEPSSAAVARP
ncbi:MAG: acyltransferase [Rhodoblastus sp.]